MLSYDITLHRYGVIWRKFTVPAKEAALVGDWFNGNPYQPDVEEVISKLPQNYTKAIRRARSWWQTASMSGRDIPLKMELYSVTHYSMGTLYATPNWVA